MINPHPDFDIQEDLDRVPEGLIPHFLMEGINEPIELHSGPVEVRADPVFYAGDGILQLRWLPSPGVVIQVIPRALTGPFMAAEPWNRPLDVSIEQLETAATARLMSVGDDGIRAMCTRLQRGVGEACEVATFEIANGYEMLGSPIRSGSSVWAGRTSLEAEGWLVTIDESKDRSDLYKSLKESRGYAITHTGLIRRRDGSRFTLEQADSVLATLTWILSFARGAFTGPLLVTGWENDSMVSFNWERNRVDPWAYRDSWFPDHVRDPLAGLFPNAYDLLQRDEWRDSLPLAIDFYLRANDVGEVETSLLLSHAGLELLAWVVLVEVTGLVNRQGFERLRFSDHLRLLLGWAGVPVSIPEDCKDLQAVSADGDWDGPFALSELRNGIVHPPKRKRTYETSLMARVDAVQLALRFYELSLLRILGYEGEVENRVRRNRWRGQTEAVPWARDE